MFRVPDAVRDPWSGSDRGVAPFLAHARDLGALERMLLAWAVHPQGAGFARAELHVWDPGRRMLAGRLAWCGVPEPLDLGGALARAARHPLDGPDVECTRRLRARAVEPERLEGVAARAWREEPVATGDAGGMDDPFVGSPHPMAIDAGDVAARRFGAVRCTRDGEDVALIVGVWDEPGDETMRLAALGELRRVSEAGLRVEREFRDGKRRARQITALGECARAGVTPLNLAEVLALATRVAVETADARGGALWLTAADGSAQLHATHGPLGTRERLGRALGPLAAATIERGRAQIVDRAGEERWLAPDLASQIQSFAILPITAYGTTLGALAVYDRVVTHPAEPGAFDGADVSFLMALADQIALAADQSRRCDEVRQAGQRIADLQRQLARRERLAALGEMAARVANEVRNPLASIGAFARRAHRQLAAEDPGREYLEIVIRETERLERMVGEQLQYATLEKPQLRLESVNAVVQQALQDAGERLVRRRVRLLKRLSPDLPPLLLDSVRIGKVVANILDHALDAVAPGGRLRVESRRSGTYALVEIAHDGRREPGDLLDQLFVPFAVSRLGGPGVGLAVAQQVLKQHGGEIRVRGEGEWSSVFSFTLPIPENEDRRRPGRDRRHVRGDRRVRAAS